MKTVHSSIEIDRPPAEVFGMLTDHSCDRNWMLGVTGTDRLTPGEMRRGTEMICRFGLGPVTMMKALAVIDEFEPGRRFIRRRVGGVMSMKGEFIVEPRNSGTKVLWTMDVGLSMPLIGILFDSVLALWMKMSITVSLNNLKRLAEAKQVVQMKELQSGSYTS